jgi:hypothetical protein
MAIGHLLCGGGAVKPLYAWPTCATLHHAVFAGTPASLDRARTLRAEPRPRLAEAFAAAGNAPARLILLPDPSHRRILEEMLPVLPKELGGGPITVLSRGLDWVALGVESDPRLAVNVIAQAHDPAAARSIGELARSALKLFAETVPKGPKYADLAKDIAGLDPRVTDNRVLLTLNLDQASSLVTAPIRAAREAQGQRTCTRQLMMIALAMHNYLSSHDVFPPPATRDAEGRPLLSWRVHILPYVEQQALYNEFHLNEPWDSAHNKTLISRIPATYVCPLANEQLSASGKTTYLVPRGKATMFPGPMGIKIKEITDGTTNTIMVVDANDESAVVWTKPDDWEVDSALKLETVLGHHPGGFLTAFADGSVRFIRSSVTLKVLRDLLTRNGGELVDPNSF